jgi:hypothetical protein
MLKDICRSFLIYWELPLLLTGIVKPNSDFETITFSIKSDIKQQTLMSQCMVDLLTQSETIQGKDFIPIIILFIIYGIRTLSRTHLTDLIWQLSPVLMKRLRYSKADCIHCCRFINMYRLTIREHTESTISHMVCI